ncbi:MAG: hypothetical protein PVI94_19570 [Desulfobacterales bacterium]
MRDLGFNYAFISTTGMISALADLTAMHLWGYISDRVRNKVVIQACSWIAVFLPFLWTFARPDHPFVKVAADNKIVAGKSRGDGSAQKDQSDI